MISANRGQIFWSEETFQIFKYDRGTKATMDLLLQRVHPEDRVLVQHKCRNVTPHIERHTFASLLASAGKGDSEILEWINQNARHKPAPC
jgi:hypothetical protein